MGLVTSSEGVDQGRTKAKQSASVYFVKWGQNRECGAGVLSCSSVFRPSLLPVDGKPRGQSGGDEQARQLRCVHVPIHAVSSPHLKTAEVCECVPTHTVAFSHLKCVVCSYRDRQLKQSATS